MADRTHTHRSTSDWIELLDELGDQDPTFDSCPHALEAWSEGLGVWADHVVGCSACREIARAQEAFAGDALECPECRDNLELVHQLLAETEHYEPATVWEMERAEVSLAELDPLSLDEQMKEVLAEPFYQQWGFVQKLLSNARAHWPRDPHLALDRSLLAVVAVQELDPESYGEPWIADLEAKAHAYVANAYRILGNFPEAEHEFALAEHCLERGVRSGQAEARVLALKVSLLKDEQRNREALALLAEVERFHGEHGERHEMGRIALQRSIVLDSLARPRDAANECARAAGLLDPHRDPSLALIARNNRIEALISAGELQRARSLFYELPPIPEPLQDLRRRWVEAALLRAEERYAEARHVYEIVQTGFQDAGLHYNAALAGLDLALTAYREGGRVEQVRQMTEEATLQLILSGAKSQAFAAQRLLLQAVREDAVTNALLERVRRRLAALQPS